MVLNVDGDLHDYQMKKENVKKVLATQRELKETKTELSVLHNELDEVKGLLKKLLEEKTK